MIDLTIIKDSYASQTITRSLLQALLLVAKGIIDESFISKIT